MGDIVPFRSAEEGVPHSAGTAMCLDCRHEWEAVAPLEARWLECPACHLVRGRFKYHVTWDKKIWVCQCGNELFSVSEKRVYCPNCGADQKLLS